VAELVNVDWGDSQLAAPIAHRILNSAFGHSLASLRDEKRGKVGDPLVRRIRGTLERRSLNMIGESTKPLGVEPASEIVPMMVHMLFRDCPFELRSICTAFQINR
jgi:hypothetical protein